MLSVLQTGAELRSTYLGGEGQFNGLSEKCGVKSYFRFKCSYLEHTACHSAASHCAILERFLFENLLESRHTYLDKTWRASAYFVFIGVPEQSGTR